MAVKPEITIIIPVHNRERIVGRTLESIRCQTFRPLAIVLVDNNSTDSTLSVLKQWKDENQTEDFIVTVMSETTPGATSARNCGLKEASSEFVMFFDSDDTMEPSHVERAMRAFRSPRRPDIVGWNVTIHDISGKTFSKPFWHRDSMWHCIMHGSMGTQRYAARRSVFLDAGNWNPRITGWNDIELGSRILLNNPRIIKLHGGNTVHIHRQMQSITGTDFSSTPEKWEQALDQIERNTPDRRQKRYVQLRRALLSGDYAREGNYAESGRLLRQTLAKESSPFYRLLYRLASTYVASGGRGAARLLRPLF